MMAGKREEWRAEPEYIPEKGWCIVAESHPHVILASGLRKERARQIVREHNLHQKMLDALKLAETRFNQYHDDDELCQCFDCVDARRRDKLRSLIAEAEKETP